MEKYPNVTPTEYAQPNFNTVNHIIILAELQQMNFKKHCS